MRPFLYKKTSAKGIEIAFLQGSTVQKIHQQPGVWSGAGGAALRGEAPGGVGQPWAGRPVSSEQPPCLQGGDGESQALCGEIHRETREILTGEKEKSILHEGN